MGVESVKLFVVLLVLNRRSTTKTSGVVIHAPLIKVTYTRKPYDVVDCPRLNLIHAHSVFLSFCSATLMTNILAQGSKVIYNIV